MSLVLSDNFELTDTSALEVSPGTLQKLMVLLAAAASIDQLEAWPNLSERDKEIISWVSGDEKLRQRVCTEVMLYSSRRAEDTRYHLVFSPNLRGEHAVSESIAKLGEQMLGGISIVDAEMEELVARAVQAQEEGRDQTPAAWAASMVDDIYRT